MTIDNSMLEQCYRRNVDEIFSWLKNFNFEYKSTTSDFDSRGESNIFVDLASDDVCVRIRWYVVLLDVEVLIIFLDNGHLPDKISIYGDKGSGVAVNAMDMFEFESNSDTEKKEITKNYKTIKGKYLKKINDLNSVDKYMKEIFSFYSDLLRQYGETLLQGNKQNISEIQKASMSKMFKYLH